MSPSAFLHHGEPRNNFEEKKKFCTFMQISPCPAGICTFLFIIHLPIKLSGAKEFKNPFLFPGIIFSWSRTRTKPGFV